jgi:hypothetical protein
MLFVDTSKSGSSAMLCFGLLLLQVCSGRTRFIREAVCKGQGAKKRNNGVNGAEKGTREKVPKCRLIHEPGSSGQSALFTVTAKRAVDLSVVKCGSIYWNSGETVGQRGVCGESKISATLPANSVLGVGHVL